MGLFFDLEFCWDGAGLGSGSWSVVGSVFGACFGSGVGLENGVGVGLGIGTLIWFSWLVVEVGVVAVVGFFLFGLAFGRFFFLPWVFLRA